MHHDARKNTYQYRGITPRRNDAIIAFAIFVIFGIMASTVAISYHIFRISVATTLPASTDVIMADNSMTKTPHMNAVYMSVNGLLYDIISTQDQYFGHRTAIITALNKAVYELKKAFLPYGANVLSQAEGRTTKQSLHSHAFQRTILQQALFELDDTIAAYGPHKTAAISAINTALSEMKD